MTTTVYGASDDLVEIDGDISEEFSSFDDDRGVLLVFSDKTKLRATYGNEGIWRIKVERAGPLLLHVDPCEEETKHGHSDVAYFLSGLTAVKAWSHGKRVTS